MRVLKRLWIAIKARGGLWGSVRVLLRKLRELGVAGTVIRLSQALLWESDVGAVRSFRTWFTRNHCESAQAAQHLFKQPSVVIVGAMDLPQCKKYRVLQKLETFESMSIPVQISHYMDSPRVLSSLQLCTHVLFYRIPLGDVTGQYLKEARRLGLHISYDIDDPIFDRPTYAANKNLSTLSATEREHLLRSSAQYQEILPLVDYCLTSTPALAALLERHTGKQAGVWPNLLDSESWSIIKELELNAPQPSAAPGEDGQSCRIGYMSGSRAHDADFAEVAEVLAALMEKHQHLELMLGGHFTLPDCLLPFSARITGLPFAGYAAYFAQLQQLDINIVPLLMDDFNNCKSAIRYLESAAMGVPSVASQIGEFVHVVKQAETGYLAATASDWSEHLEALISNPTLRKKVGAAARQQVAAEYSLHAKHEALQRCVTSLGIAPDTIEADASAGAH